MAELESLERDILARIDAADSVAALDDVRVSALGKKSAISERMKELGRMSPEERKEAGAALNVLKEGIASAIDAKKQKLERRYGRN